MSDCYYAMVVVVEGNACDPEFSHKMMCAVRQPERAFVGEPWEVKPTDPDGEFDTLGVIDQRPRWTGWK